MKKLYASLLAVFTVCFLHAQKDTLFWFAAPEVSPSTANFNIPIVMRITTFSQAATVTITQPAGTMPPQVVTIPGGATQTVDLTTWVDSIETKPPNVVLNYGLKVQSTVPVSIYYEVVSLQCNCNPEMFILKGRNALGTTFYIPGQNYVNNSASYSPLPYNSFDIVATQDNTTVTITPIKAVVGHAAGVPYNIVLNHGQTYSATAVSELAAQHLVGSTVTSNNPIAITMKDDLLIGTPFGGSCADLGGDQIVPTNIVGTEYIATKGLLNGVGDQLFITAIQNGTTVSQNGTLLGTINAGQTYQTSVGGASTLIQTSNPAYCAQLSGIGCEIGIGLLPPLLCTGSFEVAFTRSTTGPLYANIAVPAGYQGNFLVNGVAGVITAGIFAPVPGTGGAWVAGQIDLPNTSYPQGTAITVSNTTSLFRLGVLHGSGGGARFGYFSDFSAVAVTAIANANDVCTGSTIQFTADTVLDATYAWTGPNGFSSTLQDPTIPDAPVADSGQYYVTASYFGCVSKPDTIEVAVHPNYSDTVSAVICYPKTYTLPNGSLADTTGAYLVHLTTIYGCDSAVITKLTVTPPPVIIVFDSVCYGQHYVLPSGLAVNTTGVYTDTLITTGGCDSIVITNLTINPPPVTTVFDSVCYGQHYTLPSGQSVNTTGIYIDTLNTIQGCDSVVITNLTINPPPVSTVFDTVCFGGTFTLPSGVVVSSAGTYIDTLSTMAGCDSVVNSVVYILPLDVTTVNAIICYGVNYTRPGGGLANSAGIYTDTLNSVRGCDSIIITNLTVTSPPLSVVYDTICQGETFTRPSGITETSAGTYTDTLHTGAGCDSVATHVLTVINLTLTASSHEVLCYGQSNGQLIAIASGGVSPYSYHLFENGTAYGSNASGSFANLGAGDYEVSVSDNFGCSDSIPEQVTQPDSFQLSVNETDVTCYGKEDGKITINVTGGYPQYNYILGTLSNTDGLFSSLDTGSYDYIVTDAHGCSDSGFVAVHQPQQITVSLQPDSATMQLGQSLQLNAASNYDPNASYQWSPAFGLSCFNCPNPVVTLNNTTVYNLAISVNNNGNDCVKDTAMTVTVIPDYNLFVPNTFTPNGDGKNDFFQLFGNLPAINYVAIEIFDRIGEKVFESNDPYFKWDGTFKGKPLEPTVLTYMLRVVFDDGHTDKLYSGSLTLLK